MKKIYSVDRIEGNIAVVICDDGKIIQTERENIGLLCEKDVFSATEKDGIFFELTPVPEERDRRLKAAKERLERLKNRK